MTIDQLREMFTPHSKWVRSGMHHDCDYWIPLEITADGRVIMQRISGIQHQPVGSPEHFEPHRLERRKE